MVKIALVKFNSNLAFGISGGKRQDFRKWEKIIVWKDDILKLMRLWCTIEQEIDLNFKEHKDLFKQVKTKAPVEAPAETKVEEEIVEAPAETKEVA